MNVRGYLPAIVFVVLGCSGMYFILPAYARYRETRATIGQLQQELAEHQQELQRLRKELADLRTDYRAIERVAREKFRLCREDETIYQFESATPGTKEKSAEPATNRGTP